MKQLESRLAAALHALDERAEPGVQRLYLAAVSGGADSVAMLTALTALQNEITPKIALHCIHVNHGIRPAEQTDKDALHVKTLCKDLDVPCRIAKIKPGKIADFAKSRKIGTEAAARHFRYRILHKEKDRINADYILTAHTQNDVVENILMRILRGSGPAGLAPIKAKRAALLRPMLGICRDDITSYLKEKNIPYRVDQSNNETIYLRNKVRLLLIPFLNEHFPSWQSSLLGLAETQSLAAAYLKEEAEKRLPWEAARRSQQVLKISKELFLSAPQILREEAIFNAINILEENDLQQNMQKTLFKAPKRKVIRKAALSGETMDLGQVHFIADQSHVKIAKKEKPKRERAFTLLIKEQGFYTLKGTILGIEKDLSLNIETGIYSEEEYISSGLPLLLRSYANGDSILLRGHNRSFKETMESIALPKIMKPVCAQDQYGIAAFIVFMEKDKLKIIQRDALDRADLIKHRIWIEKTGGKNVRR